MPEHAVLTFEETHTEVVEMLPTRSALSGINITTITGINIAIAVNAGTIHGSAWAAAMQGLSAHA